MMDSAVTCTKKHINSLAQHRT